MFVWSYIGLIGKFVRNSNISSIIFSYLLECLFVGFLYCQDTNPLSPSGVDQNELDVNVNLYIDTGPKSSDTSADTDSSDSQTTEPFACYECINCNAKLDSTINDCEYGINMCYVRLFYYLKFSFFFDDFI
jgi:hypothetical protein